MDTKAAIGGSVGVFFLYASVTSLWFVDSYGARIGLGNERIKACSVFFGATEVAVNLAVLILASTSVASTGLAAAARDPFDHLVPLVASAVAILGMILMDAMVLLAGVRYIDSPTLPLCHAEVYGKSSSCGWSLLVLVLTLLDATEGVFTLAFTLLTDGGEKLSVLSILALAYYGGIGMLCLALSLIASCAKKNKDRFEGYKSAKLIVRLFFKIFPELLLGFSLSTLLLVLGVSNAMITLGQIILKNCDSTYHCYL